MYNQDFVVSLDTSELSEIIGGEGFAGGAGSSTGGGGSTALVQGFAGGQNTAGDSKQIKMMLLQKTMNDYGL